jgi:hypothetical protein
VVSSSFLPLIRHFLFKKKTLAMLLMCTVNSCLTSLYTRYFIYKYFPKADQNLPYLLAGSRSSVKLILRVITPIPKDGIKYQNDTLNDIESNLTVNNNKIKKSLKIPEGQSETVCRRTNNTMAKKKTYKRTSSDRQNIHIELKIE